MAINKNFVIPDVGIEVTGASVFSNNVTIAGTVSANLSGNSITSGTVSPARLGSGTANTSTFLRGDGSWTIASITLSTNNTSSNTFYLPMSANASGSWTSGVISDTSLSFVPSTGTLSATNFNSLSDVNRKNNITTVVDAVQTVNTLRGVEFEWKDNGNKSAGVIAQELEEVLPFLVETSESGTKTVNYMGIIAYLIQSVKELDTRVKQLEQK